MIIRISALLASLWFLLVAPAPASAQRPPQMEVYTVDDAHSILDFTVRLVGFNRTRGTFGVWSCDFAYDPGNIGKSSVAFVAEVASVNTQVTERDDDLRAPAFFDAKRLPYIRFQSTAVSGTPDALVIEGNLTIKDSTRRVRFAAHLINPEATDPFGNRRLAFAATATISRHDFGVNGPAFWEKAISDSVTIEMEVGGRIWAYATLGWSSSALYGPSLAAAADSGHLDPALRRAEQRLRAETDTSKLAHPGEMIRVAMRIGQGGDWNGSRRVLEMTLAVLARRWSPAIRAAIEVRLAESLYRAGDLAGAKAHIATARSLDADDTNIKMWERVISGG